MVLDWLNLFTESIMKWVVLTICLSTSIIRGQEFSIEPLGLEGESVQAIAVHPNNPNIIYAGSYETLRKSNDGGESWLLLASGTLSVTDIEINPIFPDTFLVALGPPISGILKSENGGDSLFFSDAHILTNSEVGVLDIEYNPEHPDSVWAGTNGQLGGELYLTTNGGSGWMPIGEPWSGNGIINIAIDQNYPNNIYCSINLYGEVFKSTDSGSNWSALNVPWLEHGLPTILVDRFNSNRLYAGVWVYGFATSLDAGNSWDTQYNVGGIPLDSARVTIEQDYFDSSHIYLGVGGAYFSGLFESYDQGTTWDLISPWLKVNTLQSSPLENKLFIGSPSGLFLLDRTSELVNAELDVPKTIDLQCYPNPFNSRIVFTYNLARKAENLTFSIYDISGHLIYKYHQQNVESGFHQFVWDGKSFGKRELPSGTYLFCISSGRSIIWRKITMIK